jgi:outer membrane murein-binding lipoprotein Lpp
MRCVARYGFVLLAVLTLAGCRQADGPIPVPAENVQGELEDIATDLRNVAAERDQAPAELNDDLRKYVRRPQTGPEVDELARVVAEALAGTTVSEQDAQRLAHDFWLSMVAREFSESQVEELQNNVQAILMSVGVSEELANQAAVQVGEVQRAESDRPRRWYELF